MIDSGLSGGDGVRLFDADADGDLDLTTGWEESGVTRLYLNPGTAHTVSRLWPAIDVGVAPDVEDAVMADVDRDGRTDVISATEGNSRRILVHFAPTSGDYRDSTCWTTSEFSPTIAGERAWMFSVPIDVDGDGHLDIVSGGKGADAKIGWFEAPDWNKRNLDNWTFHEIGDVGWTMSLIPEDMDGDRDRDFVVSDRIGIGSLQGARWLENPHPDGDVTELWISHEIGATGEEVMFMDVADMDGDGDRDVIVPTKSPNRIRWWERLDGTGDSWTSHEIAFPVNVGNPKGVAVGDLDGNRLSDIVLSFEDATGSKSGVVRLAYEFSVFDATWVKYELAGPGGEKYDLLALMDVDGDGDLDVVTTEENFGPESAGLGIVWYENPRIHTLAVDYDLSRTIVAHDCHLVRKSLRACFSRRVRPERHCVPERRFFRKIRVRLRSGALR